ncbi:MAG: hypothetical protein ABFS16_07900 [Bacteroidota bacterium]
MKRVKMYFRCVDALIKKIFFKQQKNDISHECQKLIDSIENIDSSEKKVQEEYLVNYCKTTRWQTL